MILVLILLLVVSIQARREEVCRLLADLAFEKIQSIAEPEVNVLLNDVERNAAEVAYIALFH